MGLRPQWLQLVTQCHALCDLQLEIKGDLCQLHQLISQMTKNRQNKIYLVTNHGNQGLQLYHNLPQTTWGQNTKHSGQWCYLEKPKVITSFLQSKKTVKLRETLKMQGYASTKNTIKNLHQGTSTSRNILTISLSLSLSLFPLPSYNNCYIGKLSYFFVK